MKGKSVVNRILSYVERNLENDLTLEEIARELHYSKFYVEAAHCGDCVGGRVSFSAGIYAGFS